MCMWHCFDMFFGQVFFEKKRRVWPFGRGLRRDLWRSFLPAGSPRRRISGGASTDSGCAWPAGSVFNPWGKPLVSLNKVLLNPDFRRGSFGGGRLTSHNLKEATWWPFFQNSAPGFGSAATSWNDDLVHCQSWLPLLVECLGQIGHTSSN